MDGNDELTSRSFHQEWHLERFFIHEPLVMPPVIPERKGSLKSHSVIDTAHSPQEEALITGIDDHRVFGQTILIQIIQYLADPVVHSSANASAIACTRLSRWGIREDDYDSLHSPEIPLHVPLILPHPQLHVIGESIPFARPYTDQWS